MLTSYKVDDSMKNNTSYLNIIQNRDCLEGMKQLPDESVDLVFTDPPYNISHKGKIFRDYRNGKNGDINMDFAISERAVIS